MAISPLVVAALVSACTFVVLVPLAIWLTRRGPRRRVAVALAIAAALAGVIGTALGWMVPLEVVHKIG